MNSIRPHFLSTDHYGLVVSTCRHLGIEEFIDNRLPKLSNNQKLSNGQLFIEEFIDNRLPKLSNNQKLSNGQLFVSMLVNAMSYVSKPMYLSPTFFRNVDVKTLFGENFDVSYLNDDAFGRLLDGLFQADVSNLFVELSLSCMKKLKQDVQCIHMDSTSFHLHGEKYCDDSFGERYLININNDGNESSLNKEPITPARGYSRDAHPELLQVMLQMITDEHGMPIYMKPQDGNTNDNTGFQASLALVKSLKDAINFRYLVADAALFTEPNLKDMAEKGILYITRAPNRLTEVRGLISSVISNDMELIDDEYSGKLTDFEYKGVKLKALCVYSQQARKRAEKSVEAKVNKEIAELEKKLDKHGHKAFSCEPDALKATNEIIKKFKFVKVKELNVTKEPVYRKGRRAADAEPVGYNHFVQLTVERNEEIIAEEKNEKAVFVIVTNDTENDWKAAELLKNYKSQQRVERGFRFLKDPQFFMDSFFLKKPERIEALLMIMVTSLFVYSATEYIIRKKLKKESKTLPNQVNKEVQNPTVRWIYSMFTNVGRMVTEDKSIYVGLTDFQRRTVEALGEEWLKMYQIFLE